ncbi:MAG: DUF2779 domain-containing protein [Thermodesulfobacteria bacterium]|nr:DUF2779 domain-containing protein [Thermodesulfobacteriota bacterium]
MLRLSKSKIISGLQCPRKLWFDLNPPEGWQGPDESLQFLFSQGHRVGEAAQGLFPGGTLIEHFDDLEKAQELSRLLLREPKPLFEAAFSYQDVLVRTDLLLPEEGGNYRLVEVKASVDLKAHYLLDCAIQYWVLRGAGVPVRRAELAHINKEFIYQGDGDYRGLFNFLDVTDRVKNLLWEVPCWLEWCRRAVEEGPPEVVPGGQCEEFYACPYQGYCGEEEEVEFPISFLPRLSRKKIEELNARGIRDLRELPEDYPLSERQKWVKEVILSGKVYVSDDLQRKLSSLPYPRYYLDFETLKLAVPIWKGTRPYEMIPFQWSCHVEEAPGCVYHYDFVKVDGEDPRRNFIESLLDVLGEEGPVIVYTNFEERMLKSIADFLPFYQEKVKAVCTRLEDLCEILRKGYCHPKMEGSWSLKKVVPALLGEEFSYESLEIKEGTLAEAVGVALTLNEVSEEERTRHISLLKKYCRHDTEVMLEIVKRLVNSDDK